MKSRIIIIPFDKHEGALVLFIYYFGSFFDVDLSCVMEIQTLEVCHNP
jgi:hypothetical protein